MPSLTIAEAQHRAAVIDVTGYRVHLDLDRGDSIFGSTSTVTFTAQVGAETFLDVKAQTVRSISFNGSSIDPSAVSDGRLALVGVQADNTVTVEADMAYSRDGHGLHRAVDDADGEPYLYAMSFLEAAPRIFACFDQPDLKAPYDLSVHAPVGWSVFGNGDSQQIGKGDWELTSTKPLSTYFVTVCAGPFATVEDEHDGIRLTLSARASQRDLLEAQAPQMLEITRQSFDFYHRLYDVRYEFGDYHQVFVPEFNAGAMENPGCVVHNDSMIFRGSISRSQLLSRSNTIAHEMAHMWFGDMVTMKWWDDLWLNESFAEYMSHRCLAEATEFTESFTDFGVGRKNWGYGADRAPSTHPVAGSPAPDAESALQNFDGISYAKGASVLRQLIAFVGDEAFVAGVRDHIRSHLYGNADLADFIGSVERASGQDLGAWEQAWLRTAGADTIAVDLQARGRQITAATARRTSPQDRPAQRPHAMDISGYTDGERVLHAEVTIDQAKQELPELVGAVLPKLLIPNASDLTWAAVELDEQSLAVLPEQLAQVDDGLARQVVWTALRSGVSTTSVDPRVLLRTFETAWPRESDRSILEVMASWVQQTLARYLPDDEHPQLDRVLAHAGATVLDQAQPGSTHSLVAARVLARSSDDQELLERWLAGDGLPEGLRQDQELRWLLAASLARRGWLDAAGIDELAARDHTMSGRLSAISAKASRPTAAAKAQAWEAMVGDENLSNYEVLAIADGFWDAPDSDLVRDYVPRYFEQVPPMAKRLTGMALGQVAVAAYPICVVEQATVDASRAALERDDLAPYVRRAVVDGCFRVEEGLRARLVYPSAT